MMNSNSIRKLLSVIGVLVLIAAMALNFTGCGSNSTPEAPPAETAPSSAETGETTPSAAAPSETAQDEQAGNTITFRLIVTDLEGTETPADITTDKEFVGEALLEQGIITGEMGPYGMYIKTVNGILADYDVDQTYWAFYVDGEYALSGVDTTPIEEGRVYSLVLTKG